MIKLHGSMKKMVCTQILSPEMEAKGVQIPHLDAIGTQK